MKRAPWIMWALVAVVVSLGACHDETPPAFYWEDFETVCDGVPCGWERVRGEPDQAIWIETIHPGEHGLRLTGEVSVRGPASEPDGTSADLFLLDMMVSARCDPGSAIEIDVVFADELGGRHVATAYPYTEDDWIDAGSTTLNFEDFVDARITHVTAIAIRKLGSGSCDVTTVAIEEGGIQYGC